MSPDKADGPTDGAEERDGELVTRAGWLAESKRDIVLVGDESPGREADEPVGA